MSSYESRLFIFKPRVLFLIRAAESYRPHSVQSLTIFLPHWLACFRLVWSTFGISFRSERMTFWRLTPCVTRPSAWAESSEARPTTDSWFLLTRCVAFLPEFLIFEFWSRHSTTRRDLLWRSVSDGCLSSTALRPSRQTWEASSLDSGAHQRRQSEPHRGRDRPPLQALPAADGSAFQTGTSCTRQAPQCKICASNFFFYSAIWVVKRSINVISLQKFTQQA